MALIDDRRRRDRRVRRDRQLRDREAAGQHDDDRDDPREDRTVDEEPCHGASPLPLRRAGGGTLRRSRWRRLGASFRRLHRRARPDLLQAFDDDACRRRRARPRPASCRRSARLTLHLRARSTLPSWPDDQRGGVALRVARDACCGTSSAFGALAVADHARTYMPGSSRCSGFGHDDAQAETAGGRVDRDVGERELAVDAGTACRPRAGSSPAGRASPVKRAGWRAPGAARSNSALDCVRST